MAILFISALTPDDGNSGSGVNVLRGIAEALCEHSKESVEFISRPAIPSFPKGKIWLPSRIIPFEKEHYIYMMPTLNIQILKTLLWGISIRREIKKWAFRHSNEELKILTYNTYHPSIKDIYKAGKKVGASIYSILYDLGMLPKRLKTSCLRRIGYLGAERISKHYIPLLDGRIIINESIIDTYAPGKDYILVDGGVNKHIISSLFELKVTAGDTLTMVCAGMLWDQNGTRLLLDMMQLNNNPNIKLIFAGKGQDVPLIKDACKKDTRIEYVGMLNRIELFQLYECADILLNIRIEEGKDYHFPSKLFEYLVTGKHVVSTPVAHAERDYGEYVTFLHDISAEGLNVLIENLIKQGKLHLLRKGSLARRFILENRNWDIQAQRILDYMNKKQY